MYVHSSAFKWLIVVGLWSVGGRFRWADMAASANVLKVSVEPSKVGFKTPNDGSNDSIVRIKINNDSKERVTYKVRLTNPERFALGPIAGFVEPAGSAYVRIKPKPFGEKDKLPSTDHFTVFIAKAPPGCNDAPAVWKHGSLSEPKQPKRFSVGVLYCKAGTPLPSVIADPKASKPASQKTTGSKSKKKESKSPAAAESKSPAATAQKAKKATEQKAEESGDETEATETKQEDTEEENGPDSEVTDTLQDD